MARYKAHIIARLLLVSFGFQEIALPHIIFAGEISGTARCEVLTSKRARDLRAANRALIRILGNPHASDQLESLSELIRAHNTFEGRTSYISTCISHGPFEPRLECIRITLEVGDTGDKGAITPQWGSCELGVIRNTKSNSLETVLDSIYLPATLRRKHLSLRILRDMISWLGNISSNEEDAIILDAATHYLPDDDNQYYLADIGTYVWPMLGFEYAHPDKFKEKKLEFLAYVFSTYTTSDAPEISLDEFDALVEETHSWTVPWQLASFHTFDFLKREIGREGGKLGKEFLLLADASDSMQLKYNQLTSPGMQRLIHLVHKHCPLYFKADL